MDWLDWILLLGRVVVVFFGMLLFVVVLIWFERKLIADLQTRIGPNRAGPFGLLITLADGVKLFFKEGIEPRLVDRPVYYAAPIVAMIPAFLGFAVIPFGTSVTLFGREVPFQLADLSVGILWIFAMSSIAVYGVVLAGWASGSNYPLLGSIRSSAQMISYEIGLGVAIVSVLVYSGELSMSGIVASQDRIWNVIPQFPAFVIYLVAALAETNRPPFDLPEAESELVAGYHTEYSGIKFALFYLGEYLHTVTVAAVAVTLFLGGWRGPGLDVLPWLWPLLWFVGKVWVVLFFYIWIRGTLPRFRYDRLMTFGWKVMIPFGLLWILATGVVVILPEVYGRREFLIGSAVVVGVALLISLVVPTFVPRRRTEEVSA
jgi:NADH-quinone oxidoreductase subunit H